MTLKLKDYIFLPVTLDRVDLTMQPFTVLPRACMLPLLPMMQVSIETKYMRFYPDLIGSRCLWTNRYLETEASRKLKQLLSGNL